MMEARPIEVSVIIPTCDRPDDLRRALQALAAATPADLSWEVLVVDNGSGGTAEPVVAAAAPFPAPICFLREPVAGLHAARHRGWHEARGDLLAYLDDDSAPCAGWLAALRDLARDPSVAMAGGDCHPAFDVPPPPWLETLWQPVPGGRVLWNLSLVELDGSSSDMRPDLIFGCNFVVRKHVLELARGFHPDSMPRDMLRFRGDGETHVSEVVRERGLRSVRHPSLAVLHRVASGRMTVEYMLRRSYHQGVSESYTSIRRTGACVPVWRHALRTLRRAVAARSPAGRTLSARMRIAQGEGFAFHQREARRTPELREWIRRPDYIGPGAAAPQRPTERSA